MLVLQRKPGEWIEIGDDIQVTVLRVKADGRVRLGILAPPGVTVHRSEVAEAIRAQQRAARELAERERTPLGESQR
jgi:carbon storage regulator